MGGTGREFSESMFAEVRQRHPDIDLVLLDGDVEPEGAGASPIAIDPALVEGVCQAMLDELVASASVDRAEPFVAQWDPGIRAGTAQYLVGAQALGIGQADADRALRGAAEHAATRKAETDMTADGLRACVVTPIGPVEVRVLYAAEIERFSVTVSSDAVAR